MKSLLGIFLLLFSLLNFSFAQGEGALPFTTVQQSPLLLGAGQIGVSIPNDEVLGFYYNPAILGYSARNNHASITVMPNKTNWDLPSQFQINSNYTFNNYGLNFGYNLAKSKLELPISIGIGYLHNKFDYGNFILTSEYSPEPIGEVENYDTFDSFSFGVGIDYFLKFNLGISLKLYDSKMGGRNVRMNAEPYSVDGTIFDYGALLIFPISELFMKNINFNISNSTILKPIANFSMGYSLANIGDEIYYVDPSQSDLFSRTGRLGYTFEIGSDIFLEDIKLNFFKYSFTAEANDILIERISGNSQYQSGIGDINFSDHLINLKSDDKVMVHKGHILRLFDTVILTYGSFDGHGYQSPRETNGLGFTSNGIFKLLNNQIQEPSINYILEHFVIEYFNSDVEFFENFQTNFDGLSIHFRGFEI